MDDSDHEVTGPLRGNRFALLNDDHSEHLNEQVGPDLEGAGRRRRACSGVTGDMVRCVYIPPTGGLVSCGQCHS